MADITPLPRAGPAQGPGETEAARRTDLRGAPPGARGLLSPSSFGEILRARQGLAGSAPPPPGGAADLRFSAHAQTRMQSRGIALAAPQMERLRGAVQKAADKGARDALVLVDDLAMVVSVANRTVVTVVDKENMKQNVFTNIDSAVIA